MHMEVLDFKTSTTCFKSQKELCASRQELLLALDFQSQFQLPQVLNFLRRKYTAEYYDVPQILAAVQDMLPNDMFWELARVLMHGAHRLLQGTSTQQNLEAFRMFGNHGSVLNNPAECASATNKDDKNSFLFADPRGSGASYQTFICLPLAWYCAKKNGGSFSRAHFGRNSGLWPSMTLP